MILSKRSLLGERAEGPGYRDGDSAGHRIPPRLPHPAEPLRRLFSLTGYRRENEDPQLPPQGEFCAVYFRRQLSSPDSHKPHELENSLRTGSSRFPFWACECAGVHVVSCTHTHMCMCVEARSQPWVPFLRNCSVCALRLGLPLSPGLSTKLDWMARELSLPPER